jgi:adenosylcobyric acid synthase
VEPLLRIYRGHSSDLLSDGALSPDGRVAGTYVHGLFARDAARHAFIRVAREAAGLEPPAHLACVAAGRAAELDRLAAHVRAALDFSVLTPGLVAAP